MAIVDINIIKEWFKNLKKPTQEQFWTWLDSFRHKWEKVPLDDVEGLSSTLQKKADLVDGVVPEDQLPFTINTNEVINIGAITVTSNNVNIGIHESGSNKVRINGQILTRAFSNDLPFVPVTIGQKFVRIVARNEPGLFFLKQSAESDEPQEPSLDPGEIHVRLILVTPDGSYIDPELLNGFKEKVEDTWKKVFPSGRTGNFNLHYSDKRTFFSLEQNFLGAANGFSSIVFHADESRDVTFTIRNNYNTDVTLFESDTDGLTKGIFNNGEDFVLKQYASVVVKYNHELDRLEILKFGATDSTDSITSITTDSTLKGTGTLADPAGLSASKNDEIAGKLDKIATTTQTVASAVIFSGNISTPKLILQVQSSNTTVGALWSDGQNAYYNGSGGTPKKMAYDENGVNVPVIYLAATTINIATAVDANGYKMHGKSIVHDNTADCSITVSSTADANFICEGVKTTNNLNFVAGSGITIIQEDGVLVVSGLKGSSYRLRRLSSTEYALSIRNI